ncbi:MAG: dihydrofolate reductase family protein [Anaerolineaceae bacterium]|nr:dihydrofolate reductase family protein [Anaerolineaceae bacterium]
MDMQLPDHLEGKVRTELGNSQDIVSKLEKQGKKHLYIDGGKTIQRFLKAWLIDEITITRIPILLGSGIPLFGPSGIELKLQLIDVFPSENGFVQERYGVVNLIF